jgi:hypothetical protein
MVIRNTSKTMIFVSPSVTTNNENEDKFISLEIEKGTYTFVYNKVHFY